MTDSRAHARILIRVLVDFDSSDTFLYAISRDIAEGGVFVETDKLLPVDKEIAIKFTLPNIDRVFEVKTRVAWVSETSGRKGMGLQFMNLTETDKDVLSSYISRLATATNNDDL